MATKTKSKTIEKAEKKPQKYSIEKLQANCHRIFGISTSAFAGATYGLTGDYTVDEIKTHIQKWSKKGVK